MTDSLRGLFERLRSAPPGASQDIEEGGFAAAVAAARAALGPPPMVQGFGPVLRWRGEQTTILLHGGRGPRVEVVDTEAFETEEYRTYNSGWNEPCSVEQVHAWVWMRQGVDAIGGLSRPGPAVFKSDWDDFGDSLRELLEDFAATLAVVHEDLRDVLWVLSPRDESLRCVQGYLSPGEQGVYVEVRRGPDDADELPLGPLSTETAGKAARIAVDTFREWGLDSPAQLRQRIFSEAPGWLDVHVLGLRLLDRDDPEDDDPEDDDPEDDDV